MDTELVGYVVVLCDVSAHLTPIVGEEDALGGLEAHTGHAAEAGPDQLRIPVLAGALSSVEPHRIARIRRQVYTVIVLRERRWRLHGLDHPGIVKSVVTECRYARPYDGSLRQPLTGRHRIHSSTKRCLQNSSALSQVHFKISNRPANAFRGVTVTEFRKTTKISTRFSTLCAVRLLSRPGLVADHALKHNTRAGSSRVGTKENPFAAVNFVRKLAADDLNRSGSNENWQCVRRHRPAGERERRPPVSLLCFDTQLFV